MPCRGESKSCPLHESHFQIKERACMTTNSCLCYLARIIPTLSPLTWKSPKKIHFECSALLERTRKVRLRAATFARVLFRSGNLMCGNGWPSFIRYRLFLVPNQGNGAEVVYSRSKIVEKCGYTQSRSLQKRVKITSVILGFQGGFKKLP